MEASRAETSSSRLERRAASDLISILGIQRVRNRNCTGCERGSKGGHYGADAGEDGLKGSDVLRQHS